MDCPKCGSENPDNVDRCESCGTEIDVPIKNAQNDAPAKIRGINFGAFALTWVWAFAHRQWGWGIVMLALYPFNQITLPYIMNLDDDLYISFFPLLMFLKWILSFYLGLTGNRLIWEQKSSISMEHLRSQNFWDIAGVVYILVFIGVFSIWPNPPLRAHAKASFMGCEEQLKNISSGMEQEISEKGSLKNIHSVEDVCHHILSGYDKPAECRGEVEKRVEEVCLKGSLRFKKIDEKKYEIKAKSNEKIKCNICVTETAVRPQKYGPEECAATTCVH